MASGLMQLLKAFGIDINPEEIKEQALQFKGIMLSIDQRLAIVQAQNAAIIRHLKIEVENADSGTKVEGP